MTEDDEYLIPPRLPEKISLPAACRLIEGDAFEHLRGCGDGEYDHVITDPPYSEVTHDGARGFVPTGMNASLGFADGEGTKRLIDFPPISRREFLDVCRECVRVARRWVVMTCDWRFIADVERGMPDEFIRFGVWVKPDSGPQFSGDRPGCGWEAVLMLHRVGKKRWNGGGSHASWIENRDRDKLHPAQKPLSLVRRWVRLFTDPGDHVLDPFAGSGTTGVASLLEGRSVTLVEKDHEHCNKIRMRLDRPFPRMGRV